MDDIFNNKKKKLYTNRSGNKFLLRACNSILNSFEYFLHFINNVRAYDILFFCGAWIKWVQVLEPEWS